MSARTAAIIGSVIGVLIVGYAFMYVPMSRNHAECGKITLCQPEQGK